MAEQSQSGLELSASSGPMRRKFGNFLQSLGDVLVDITALEVNTMVVEQITGTKFIPWQAYRNIYLISRNYLERQNIHPFLINRYLALRKQLEMEYCLYILETQMPEKTAAEIREYIQVMGDSRVEVDLKKSKLPNPFTPTADPAKEIQKIQLLLDDGRFLRSLRKMEELRSTLDNRNRCLQQNPNSTMQEAWEEVSTDMIYAQSVIQLDGDIINRYHQKLFDHEHRDLILQIHKEGVTCGERQWRGLLEFMVNLVSSIFTQNNLFRSRN